MPKEEVANLETEDDSKVEDEVTETEDNEEVEDDESEVEEETEEVVAKADLEKVQKALESERTLKKELTAENRKLKRELKAATEATPEDADSQKLVAEADKRADKFRDIAVRKEAALALTEAGAKVSTKRLMKLLDLVGVEISDDGDVDGLADAIDELKEESPEFFKSDDDEEETKPVRTVTVKTGTVDAGKKTPPQPKPLSAAQQMAKLAVGRR